MFYHNLLISLRNFSRNKVSFFVNLVGLSTALASSLLIWTWVTNERSVDKFHVHDDRLYQVLEHRVRSGGIWTATSTPGPMASVLAMETPGVEMVVNTTLPRKVIFGTDTKNILATGIYAGREFFQMFSFPLSHGNKRTALADKQSAALSMTTALKLFRTPEEALGQVVLLEGEKEFVVSGIFNDLPATSSMQFDFVLAFEQFREGRDWLETWDATAVFTYVLLKPDVAADAFNKNIAAMVKDKTENRITHRVPFAKRYSEGYLYGEYVNGVQSGGRITYVNIFSAVAMFILAIACINFVNLSTARASRRMKEIGVKKAAGAGRNSLIMQFLTESVLVSVTSLLAAVLILKLALPFFNELVGKSLVVTPDIKNIAGLFAFAVALGVVAGFYPSIYLSGFQPLSLLQKSSTSIGHVLSRKGLVAFQFVITISFLVLVCVTYKQMQLFRSADLGYDRKNIIYFQLDGNLRDTGNQESLIATIKELPGVVNASSMSHDMTGHNGGTYDVVWEGKDPEDKTEFERATINYNMIETFGIEMASGRSFSQKFGNETSKVVFNEAAIEFMGLNDPIGKVVRIGGKEMEIIGVAKNFHFESLHQPVKPMFFRLNPYDTYMLVVKLAPGKEYETLAKLDKLYSKFNPGFPFDFRFLEDDYFAQYSGENRISELSRYFAVLAVIISCLGLFGLATFTAERRAREISIRKVLGSTAFGIVYLLSSEFTRIVRLSICIALPLSYFIAKWWLADFAYRIDLEWWFFVGAALGAWSIAWLTVAAQTIRAATSSPVRFLRNE